MTDDDGWEYFRSLDVDKGDVNKPFYLKQFGKDYYVICFTSVILASQAPNLTIIVLKDGKATLVYNKPAALNTIKEDVAGIQFEGQSEFDYIDYVNGKEVIINVPKHTLTFKDGMISFVQKFSL